MLSVTASPSFTRIAKKLHTKDKQILDKAIQWIAANHLSGDEKRGDLDGVFIYTFKLKQQETLLAYELKPDKFKPSALVLLAVGPHENFYAALKR
jgi:mRNA-degrading endonuclease RelE of RelBE toxin-antitoxin system